MRDTTLYEHLLDVQTPWQVDRIKINDAVLEIRVHLELAVGAEMRCPECGQVCGRYDKRESSWRHLDTCEYKTILVAQVPRIQCPNHGVRTCHVPWADGLTPYTMKFETHVIEWLKESTISGVSRRLGLNWKSVSLIMERAVARGQARRQSEQPRHLCVDETSFQKRHEYVTVVTDADSGAVQWVSDNRTVDSLAGYFAQLPAASLHGIATVSMDMWSPYVKATRDHLPSADTKICFDRFHVQRMILEAVDRVRKVEHAGFRSTGHSLLTGTKYWWLTNPANLSRTVKTQLQGIRTVAMRTARAWRLKEAASLLWHYASRTWAVKAWRAWIAWARRSKLDPIKRVAITIRQHLWGILNAVIHGVSNGRAESANSKIQLVKSRARGYRSRIRFRTAIMFYCGQLDLLPRTSA